MGGLLVPRKKKRVTEMPDSEAIRKLFPKKVVDQVERIAHEKDKPEKPSKKE
jgi:hypothetical protein